MYTGKCLCGAVSYEFMAELDDVTYCHCSMCRKLSGSAFLAFGSVKHEDLTIMGQQSLSKYSASSSATRMFCQQCGSTMFWQETGEYGDNYMCIALGTLDSEVKPSHWRHFYTACKASWYEILDNQQQFDSTC